MRTALVSLIALSAAATAAMAQEAVAPAAPPATPPAAAAPPAAPAAPASPDAAAQPAAPAAPAAEEPPPQLPTSGDGAEVISFLEKVCVPAVAQLGGYDKLAKAYGMKADRKSGGFIKQLGTTDRAFTINLVPSPANPNVCWAEVHYAVGGSTPIVSALNIWSYLHQPELHPQRRDFATDANNKRITSSWEYYTDKESTGLVMVELFKPDGTPLNAKYDTATIQFSHRTF